MVPCVHNACPHMLAYTTKIFNNVDTNRACHNIRFGADSSVIILASVGHFISGGSENHSPILVALRMLIERSVSDLFLGKAISLAT